MMTPEILATFLEKKRLKEQVCFNKQIMRNIIILQSVIGVITCLCNYMNENSADMMYPCFILSFVLIGLCLIIMVVERYWAKVVGYVDVILISSAFILYCEVSIYTGARSCDPGNLR